MSRSDSVPAPMVQLPADKLEALRTTHTRWEVSDSDDAQVTLNLVAAVRAVVDAATPAASVPAADILALADKWTKAERRSRRGGKSIEHARDGFDCAADLRTLVAAAEQADKGEAADTPRDEEAIKCPTCGVARGWNEDGRLTRGIWTLNCVRCGSFQVEIEDAPAAPVGEPLPEGWHHIPWTSKEDGVGAPETPASGESGPPAPPALCVGCGHDVGLHNEKGCLHGWAGPEGLCRCRLDGSQAPRVPVNDEAEAVVGHLREFLPDWGYPAHVVAAICLEVKARMGDRA